MPLPRSLANLKREVKKKKWEEARKWSKERINKKYGMPKMQRPNGLVDRGSKRLAERFHHLRTGHCRTGQYMKWTKKLGHGGVQAVSVQGADKRTPLQELCQMEATAEEPVSGDAKEDRKREESIHRPGPVCR